jgi:hypothetical protein
MEVPSLCVSLVGCLDNHLSVVDQVKISVIWELGYNVEVSLNIKTEVLIEFSLSWFTLPFISIDDVPLLVDLTVLSMDDNVSVF